MERQKDNDDAISSGAIHQGENALTSETLSEASGCPLTDQFSRHEAEETPTSFDARPVGNNPNDLYSVVVKTK